MTKLALYASCFFLNVKHKLLTDLKIRLTNRLVLGISLFRVLSYKFFQKKLNWSTDCIYFLVFDYNFFWKTLKSNSSIKRIINKNNSNIWSIATFLDRDFLTFCRPCDMYQNKYFLQNVLFSNQWISSIIFRDINIIWLTANLIFFPPQIPRLKLV